MIPTASFASLVVCVVLIAGRYGEALAKPRPDAARQAVGIETTWNPASTRTASTRSGELLLLAGDTSRPAAPRRTYRHLSVAPGIPEWGYECLAPIDVMLVRLREMELAEDDSGVARTIRKVFDAWKSRVYGIPNLAEATEQREDFTANLRRYEMERLDHSAKFYMTLNDNPDQAAIHHRNERLAEVQVAYTTFALESVTCIENRHRAAR